MLVKRTRCPPFEFIYLLPVSTIAAMLSLKNILSKMAMALLVLLAPGYIYIHYATLAPALKIFPP